MTKRSQFITRRIHSKRIRLKDSKRDCLNIYLSHLIYLWLKKLTLTLSHDYLKTKYIFRNCLIKTYIVLFDNFWQKISFCGLPGEIFFPRPVRRKQILFFDRPYIDLFLPRAKEPAWNRVNETFCVSYFWLLYFLRWHTIVDLVINFKKA